MLTRIDLRGQAPSRMPSAQLAGLLPRAGLDVDAAVEQVRPICEAVRLRGAQAVSEYTARFDKVELASTVVPAEALSAALAGLDPPLRAALTEARRRSRLVHQAQMPAETWSAVAAGSTVTERYVPVRRAGVYVPGGLVAYPSSVLMNVIPAQVAGVNEIAVASPPQPEFGGLPHPSILAACALLGITEVHAAGGAQAVAMFGYGTRDCRPVDVVTGPGNVYVAAAKRLLLGRVGIDAEAGPTEIAILADDTADPRHVAADLISQAEHDPLAASVLVTDSEALVAAVEAELTRQVAATKHEARVLSALTGEQSGVVLVDDLEQGLRVVDAYAAEHLEIQTRDARQWAMRVRNAGAIFVGAWSPVSLGDYAAGSNHVLPTGGCARHSSGLSVQSFLRGIHVVEYDEAALRDVAGHVVALANAEDLPAHGDAVKARFPR